MCLRVLAKVRIDVSMFAVSVFVRVCVCVRVFMGVCMLRISKCVFECVRVVRVCLWFREFARFSAGFVDLRGYSVHICFL